MKLTRGSFRARERKVIQPVQVFVPNHDQQLQGDAQDLEGPRAKAACRGPVHRHRRRIVKALQEQSELLHKHGDMKVSDRLRVLL